MSLEKIAESVTKSLDILKSVSATTITKLFVLVIGLGVAYTAWEHRTPAWKNIVAEHKISLGQMPVPPSKESKDEIVQLVKQSDIIGAAQIVNVDFIRNERSVVFTNSDDDTITYELDQFYKHRTSATPFFLPRDSVGAVENNWRSVDIINGTWNCEKFENTIGARNFPKLVGRIAQLCSVSIPPIDGYFSGYLTVWLLSAPDPGTAEDIKRKTRSASRVIWEKEFKR